MFWTPRVAARLLCIIAISTALPGCASPVTAQRHDLTTETPNFSTLTPTLTLTPTAILTRVNTPTGTPNPGIWASATALATRAIHKEATATLLPTASPENWQDWPVVPEISAKAIEIYQKGQQMGNDPRAFSKVGNCLSNPKFYLGAYDNRKVYNLGSYQDLQSTIDYFSGSFSRESVAVNTGWSIASVLNPLYAAVPPCNKGENPFSCELRITKPAFVIVSVEPIYANITAEHYAGYLRQIVEYAVSQGTLPILATKADDLEGDNSLNLAIARIANDYGVPLWNFWAAVQNIPDKGLEKDGFHLTGLDSPYNFADGEALQGGWARRNLTLLQTLDAVRKAVTSAQ
jgi:hypothetical protein